MLFWLQKYVGVIVEKWLSFGTIPLFPPIFLYQNGSEWPEMDFKHNFEKRVIFIFEAFFLENLK